MKTPTTKMRNGFKRENDKLRVRMGKILHDTRVLRGLTQEQVAAAIEIRHSQTIGQYEVGGQTIPPLSVKRLCRTLNITYTELLGPVDEVDETMEQRMRELLSSSQMVKFLEQPLGKKFMEAVDPVKLGEEGVRVTLNTAIGVATELAHFLLSQKADDKKE